MGEQKASVGRMVHFAPPQECVGPESLLLYPAIITQVNPQTADLSENQGCGESVELVTFGPNSVYFQHKIPFSAEAKPGHWNWPPRV